MADHAEVPAGVDLSQLDQYPELMFPMVRPGYYDSDDDSHDDEPTPHHASHGVSPLGPREPHDDSSLEATAAHAHNVANSRTFKPPTSASSAFMPVPPGLGYDDESASSSKKGSGVLHAPPLVPLNATTSGTHSVSATPVTPGSPNSPSPASNHSRHSSGRSGTSAQGSVTDQQQDTAYSSQVDDTSASNSENEEDRVKPAEPSDFKFLRVIGVGGYGKVFQVKKLTGPDKNTVYAAKVLKKADVVTKRKNIVHALAERKILEKIKFPFIVGLNYAFQTNERLFLVMPYLSGGELFGLLDREGILLEDETRFYVAELVLALDHLHRHGIVYRDLKPENIMLNAEGHITLTDFGMCKEMQARSGRTNTFCGTLEYMAPEVIANEGHNAAADWWSLGALTYDMLCGQPPFTDRTRKRLTANILRVRYRFNKLFTTRSQLFIRMFLRRNPAQRVMDMNVITTHAFFNNLDFDDVLHMRIRPPYVPRLADAADHSYFSREFTQRSVSHSPAPPVHLTDDDFGDFNYVAGEDGRNLLPPPRSPSPSRSPSPRPRVVHPEEKPSFEHVDHTVDHTVHTADLSVGLCSLKLNTDGSAQLQPEAEAAEAGEELMLVEEEEDDEGDGNAALAAQEHVDQVTTQHQDPVKLVQAFPAAARRSPSHATTPAKSPSSREGVSPATAKGGAGAKSGLGGMLAAALSGVVNKTAPPSYVRGNGSHGAPQRDEGLIRGPGKGGSVGSNDLE